MVGNFARKPAYHFGWDWGPRYVTAGVWRGVDLQAWDAHRLIDLAVRTDALSAEQAKLAVLLEMEQGAAAGSAVVNVDVRDPQGRIVAQVQRTVLLKPGQNAVEVPVELVKPQRWWPVGHGAQDRYTVQARLDGGADAALVREQRIGLRTVELRREQDGKGGQGFAFVINGVEIFAKGANVIPFDAFPARVDAARLRQVLTAARDANMNMLRNWGGRLLRGRCLLRHRRRTGPAGLAGLHVRWWHAAGLRSGLPCQRGGRGTRQCAPAAPSPQHRAVVWQ
nr:hypothetical protein [Stenotrophomonas maltophilia]